MRAIFAAALLAFELPGLVAAQSTPLASPSPTATPSPEDAALLKEIEASAPPTPTTVSPGAPRGSSGSFLSNVLQLNFTLGAHPRSRVLRSRS